MLTTESAIAYVRGYFARANEPVTIIEALRVTDESMINVWFDIGLGRECFTVWIEPNEDGTPFIYGEY